MNKFAYIFIKALPFLYMGFIWYLSSHPSDQVIDTRLSFDGMLKETLHLVEFAALYGFWVLFFLVDNRLNFPKSILAAVIAAVYAFLDEFHQSFVPERSAALIDIIKDLTGIFAAWAVVNRYYLKNSRSKFGLLLNRVGRWFNAERERETEANQETGAEDRNRS